MDRGQAVDIERIQLDLAGASKELEKQRQEIAELKFKLKVADEHCASYIAAFVGEEFESAIASLEKKKDATQTDSNGDRATLNNEILAWGNALKILLKHTGKESATVKALAKSLIEKPVDARERPKMEEIIATLISMVPDFPADNPYKAAGLMRVQADLNGIPFPSSDETVKKYLEAAQSRATQGGKSWD